MQDCKTFSDTNESDCVSELYILLQFLFVNLLCVLATAVCFHAYANQLAFTLRLSLTFISVISDALKHLAR